MRFAKINSKGQVTIPVSVRQSLGLHPGDRIKFVLNKNGEVLFMPIVRKVDDVFGKLYKSDQKSISVEEMDEAVKEKLKKRAKK